LRNHFHQLTKFAFTAWQHVETE